MSATFKEEVKGVRKTQLEPLEIKAEDRRRVRHDQRRQSYLAEAMRLVIEEGMEGLTIGRLASRMKASIGAVYRYFPSKEALIVSLQELAIADFEQFMAGRLKELEPRLAAESSPGVRALARLMAAFQAYIDHADVSPRSHRLVDTFLSFPEVILSDAEALSINQRLVAPILESYKRLLSEATAAGVLEPGDDLQRTHLAWACVHGLDHFRKRDRLNPPQLQLKVLLPLARGGLLRAFGAKPADIALAERLLQADAAR
jgi:AcrR family transcriptional regulator